MFGMGDRENDAPDQKKEWRKFMKGKHISITIQSIAALLFIFVLGNFIPTWSTVSRMGVQYICIMVGWIWLCVLCGGLLLPSAMAMVGCLLPGYFTPATLVSCHPGQHHYRADDFHLHSGVYLPKVQDR